MHVYIYQQPNNEFLLPRDKLEVFFVIHLFLYSLLRVFSIASFGYKNEPFMTKSMLH